uniref:DUF1353 domain-containing protein n=1 Tax=viral metagenome TaxID=1070528 RepID=A0A6H2A2A9_9ZZZZ
MIKYRSGYKYQLAENYAVNVPIQLSGDIHTEYISLSKIGILMLKIGYAWDGPSGPTVDTKNFMRGSLVHDALYQLLRQGLLDPCYREIADRVLHTICIEDGMSSIRAWWVYRGVRFGGGPAADPKNAKKVYDAP